MARYRKRPVIVEATQWRRNGDHPDDFSDRDNAQGSMVREGMVVRYFRNPNMPGDERCAQCGNTMHDHGWIDTVQGGHIVCPGDWIITDDRVNDPRGHGHYYPCKPDIFAQTYEQVT